MKNKILIVEDDQSWIGNYIRILSPTYTVDAAISADIGIDKLKQNYYSLVILDLSLDPTNNFNRDSKYIMEYLKNHQEATQFIVASGNINIKDIKQAAFNYGAFDVFEKAELADDIQGFVNRINEGVVTNNNDQPNFIKNGYEILLGANKDTLEFQLSRSLKSEKGVDGFSIACKELLKQIVPIAKHMTRQVWDIKDECAIALVWSRKLGKAVSICIHNPKRRTDTLCTPQNVLSNTLGWEVNTEIDYSIYSQGLEIAIRQENLDSGEFELPKI